VVVDLTSELRWFFDGPVPRDVHAWFTHDGATGLIETRRDTYRLDGQVDIGVKRRYETILELKLRQGTPRPFPHRDLDGQLEVWRRWSPADDMIFLGPNTRWVDVDKTVIKRRFAPDGDEAALTHETRAMSGNGCDAEVAGVTVRGRPAWTFALAAFGPTEDHTSSLTAAWASLMAVRSLPRRLPLPWANSCGYPEWMAGHFHDGESSDCAGGSLAGEV
jgi:hypothetical protein